MAQLVTIQQAARNALAAWLVTDLAAVSGLKIEPRWVEVDVAKLPLAITVIDAGPRRIEWGDPVLLSSTPINATQVEGVWALGDVEQRVQLDIWAPSDVQLDDIMARLDRSLNANVRPIGGNGDPFAPGLLVNMVDGWAPGTANFLFDEPDTGHTADDANQQEWRGMYRGMMSARLCAKAISPRLARLKLKQRISETDAAAVEKDVLTLTTSTESYSTE